MIYFYLLLFIFPVLFLLHKSYPGIIPEVVLKTSFIFNSFLLTFAVVMLFYTMVMGVIS